MKKKKKNKQIWSYKIYRKISITVNKEIIEREKKEKEEEEERIEWKE